MDTRDAFLQSVDDLIRPGNVVGVDGEWRPCFGQSLGGRFVLSINQLLFIDDRVFWDPEPECLPWDLGGLWVRSLAESQQ